MDKKYTVIYIDDNWDNRILVERFLGFEGFEVYSAGTGQKGLEQADKVIPDVFLIDLNLPDMDGYEIVDVLNNRVETQCIPKIIFSATDFRSVQSPVKFDYFLTKPLDINTLAERIEYAIRHPHGSKREL
jgi:two-component system, cell cycle response regulator DivK